MRTGGFEPLYACETAHCDKAGVQPLIERLPEKTKWQASETFVEQMFAGGAQPGFHFISARKNTPAGPVHVQVAVVGGDEESENVQGRIKQFVQVIEPVRVELGKVTVDAKAIGEALQRDGKIALYGVKFDANKATVKDESSASLQEMAAALNA